MRGGEIFVPKIPSMNIVDLAKAIAPECRLDVIGIRPGEKLHETMVPEDDARNTFEYDDHFVIRSSSSEAAQRFAIATADALVPKGFATAAIIIRSGCHVHELQHSGELP